MKKIKTGDQIIVIAGKDKGRRGKVLRFSSHDRVVVEGINQVKKHIKGDPNRQIEGGIELRDAPIHISNIALFNPMSKKADKVGIKKLEDGRKVRMFKSNEEMVDAS